MSEISEIEIKSMLEGVGKMGQYPYIDNKKLKSYVDYSDKIEDNDKALKFLEDVKLQLTDDSNAANKGSSKSEGADKNYFNLVNSKIDERNELKKGGITPKSARILKLKGKTAAEASAARSEWNRITNLPDLYYVNPGAILPALQRALLPEERTTDEDVKRGYLSAAGIEDSVIDRVLNAFAASNGGTFATMMRNQTYATAARALAPYVMGVMKNKYNTLVKETGNENDVDKALQETYGISDNILDYLKGKKILYTEKNLYEKEAEKRISAQKQKEKDFHERESSKNSNDGEIDEEEFKKVFQRLNGGSK